MAARQSLTLELDAEVAALIRERAVSERISEGEVVERALRGVSFRSLLDRIHSRSDLDEDAAMKLAAEELRAARAERDAHTA